MPSPGDVAFGPAAKAWQTRFGSREAYERRDEKGAWRTAITPELAAFIAERDSFYFATAGASGQPYVQHRGGPVGFLKVLDTSTIGFADFRGNRQYLSVGNITADERISLILMDYPRQRRLKLWGRARIVHEAEQPEILAAVEDPAYRARIERAIVISIEAFDWNCPQHITPRFSADEIRAYIDPIIAENDNLKLQLQMLLKDQAPR